MGSRRGIEIIVHVLLETGGIASIHVKLMHLLVVIIWVIGRRTALETLDPMSTEEQTI